MAITLEHYYKEFKSLFGGITAVIAAFPLVATFVPANIPPIILPPVESSTIAVSEIFVLFFVVWVFFLKDLSLWQRSYACPIVMFLFLILGFIAYLFYYSWTLQVVRVIHVPINGQEYVAVIGLQRSPFAEQFFPNATDEEMLKERGVTEEEIRRLWIPESVYTAKTWLVGYYFLTLICITITGSVGVLCSCLDKDRQGLL